MNNAARQQGVSPHYSRTSPDSGIYASGLCCWKGIPVGYWLFPDSVLEAQDRQDKGSLVSVLPGLPVGGVVEKKNEKKGFADDIVMLNPVIDAAGRCFFLFYLYQASQHKHH